MFTDTHLTLGIALMGFISVIINGVAIWKFSHYTRLTQQTNKLISAINLQLFGELVLIAGTLIFSIGAFFGLLHTWPSELHSLLRFIMFGFGTLTTLRLVIVLRSMNFTEEDTAILHTRDSLDKLKKLTEKLTKQADMRCPYERERK